VIAMEAQKHGLSSSKLQAINLPSFTGFREAAEGGCGVIGVACSIPVKGRYLIRPLVQMHNRGNGKGGGIAAVGLSSKQMGVSERILQDSYLVQIAYIDTGLREEVESNFIYSHFNVQFKEKIPTIKDYRRIGLDVKPPDVWRYFVRVNEDSLKDFAAKKNCETPNISEVEDEFVYRNSYSLNKKYYSSLGERKAFVLSHGKNMAVFKIVGYAEQVLKYYKLEDMEAHVWIGHQRYPTKGKVWHPGGSHPFVGLHDALVHNGDFANYRSITDYLGQRDIHPLFLTDTEVAALYWDLLTRVYRYPLEYAIEAVAPTTERDFVMLSEEKKKIYKAIQTTHIHGSPDGPWFFIIARNDIYNKRFQLIGITDTSMLRPQVFALQEGAFKIGLIASEKQAIDSMLECLARDDDRFHPMADLYWYARGGSYTDGGAFIFTVEESKNLLCTDKFGKIISTNKNFDIAMKLNTKSLMKVYEKLRKKQKPIQLFENIASKFGDFDLDEVYLLAESMKRHARKGDEERANVIETLTLLIDRRYDTGWKRRSAVIPIFERALFDIFDSIGSSKSGSSSNYLLVDCGRRKLTGPSTPNRTLVIDACDFHPEGEICEFLEEACRIGWRKIIAYNFRGQRNFGAGLVTGSEVRIDLYGRVGDCLASFADGPEFYVHGSVQDSVAYCFRSGKIVVFGDAGKAFEYGAKGGVAYVLGDLIDRPLINAVGSSKAVINGSCKDYMGESFMAASGFIILNGIRFDESGKVVEQETPYQGGNIFPLAAAGSIYIRDPWKTVGEDQLNGGKICEISREDWEKILPFLEENEQLFGIKVEDLLKVGGVVRRPEEVYRKVVPAEVAALARYEGGD